MAELHVNWLDGRREVHEVKHSGKIVSIGNSLLPFEMVEIGNRVTFGGRRSPWLRVRIHGPELPSLVLLTQERSRDRLVLPPKTKKQASVID